MAIVKVCDIDKAKKQKKNEIRIKKNTLNERAEDLNSARNKNHKKKRMKTKRLVLAPTVCAGVDAVRAPNPVYGAEKEKKRKSRHFGSRS